MSRIVTKTACALLVAALPGVVLAQTSDRVSVCDRRAKQISGYEPGLIPPFKIGPFTAKISGSVAIGVSRSSGSGFEPSVPRGAGAGAREMRAIRAEQRYKQEYAACIAGR